MSATSPVSPRPPSPGSNLDQDFGRRLAAAREGSLDARGEVLQRCRDYLLAVAGRELLPEVRAKVGASDLVQEALTLAHANFDRFDGKTEGELFAWLTRIVDRRVLSAKRRYLDTGKRDARKEQSLDEADDSGNPLPLAANSPTPASKAVRQEDLTRLQAALARLRPVDREIIELRNLELLSFVAIGEQTGRTADAARKQWVRAMERLMDELGE